MSERFKRRAASWDDQPCAICEHPRKRHRNHRDPLDKRCTAVLKCLIPTGTIDCLCERYREAQ